MTIDSKGFMKACGGRHYRTGSPLRVFWNAFCGMAWLDYCQVPQMHSRLLCLFRVFPDRRGVAREIFI
jgi:hypothetical protein